MNYTGKKVNELKSIIINDIESKVKSIEIVRQKTPNEILQELTNSIGQIDFKLLAFPESEDVQKQYTVLEKIILKGGNLTDIQQVEFEKLAKKLNNFKLSKNHYLVLCIEKLLEIANVNKWDLCKNEAFIFLYNGFYWNEISKELLQSFLGKTALKMGVEKFKAKIFSFQDELFKQFMAEAYLPKPEPKPNCVLINLQNGTFEITPTKRGLRNFEQKDFITHQLPFEYDPEATAPQWQKFLDEVLPDKNKQKVFAEFFITNLSLSILATRFSQLITRHSSLATQYS